MSRKVHSKPRSLPPRFQMIDDTHAEACASDQDEVETLRGTRTGKHVKGSAIAKTTPKGLLHLKHTRDSLQMLSKERLGIKKFTVDLVCPEGSSPEDNWLQYRI